MAGHPLAHVADSFSAPSSSQWLWWVLVLAAALALSVQHLFVKHRGQGAAVRASIAGSARRNLGLLVVAALATVMTPAAAQSDDAGLRIGLPDMVSDPPFIWFNKIVFDDDGTAQQVMAFDGYLHNIGEGMLDVAGNPQVEGGVTQRMWDGEAWVDVGTPTVLYETTDDHDHFHLMAAASYELWDEGQTRKVSDASKVGFCLVDTQQMNDELDTYYGADAFDYCAQGNPDATDLRMGISPGWRDTYDANTTLQWVDTSNIAPGRYWVGAIMDPNNEIVESNEDNNGLVFSQNKFSVPGYAARLLEPQVAGEPIMLKADVYSGVGARAFVIVEGPTNGTLDIPTGVDYFGDTVVYTPDPGFSGTDTFTYIAHDVTSQFPWEPQAIEVEVAVDDSVTASDTSDADDADDDGPLARAFSTPASLDITTFAQFEASAEAGAGEPVDWFALGLPVGLSIDQSSGVISGVAEFVGEGVATIVALSDGIETRLDVEWTVEAIDQPSLSPINDFETGIDELVREFVGSRTPDAVYTSTGMPEGTNVVENIPMIAGTPTEIGEFDVVVTETLDGEVLNTIEFVWSVRPSAIPAFVL